MLGLRRRIAATLRKIKVKMRFRLREGGRETEDIPAVADSNPDSRRSEVVVEAGLDWVHPRYP